MARKLKILGAALVAVFAMSAAAAQGASAAGELFHSHIEPTVLTGEAATEQVFTLQGVPIKCKKATFAATQLTRTAGAVELHPEYDQCSIGSVLVTWTIHNCTYTLGSETTTNPNEPAKQDGPLTIECTAGSTPYFEAGVCKVTIETPQTVHGVGYKNEGTFNTLSEGASIKDILLTATAVKIKYIAENTVGKGTKCGTLGIALGTKEDGKYTGTTTVKGYEDLGDTAETGAYNEGAQVGIWWQ